jgi:hypothetical protein
MGYAKWMQPASRRTGIPRGSSSMAAERVPRITSMSLGSGKQRSSRLSRSASSRYDVTRGSGSPAQRNSARCSDRGRARVCEGSRSRSTRLNSAALTGSGEASVPTTITVPPGVPDARHLSEHGGRLGEVMEGVAGGDECEGAVREGQRQHVTEPPGHVRQPEVPLENSGALKHGRRDVDAGGMSHGPCKGAHDVTGPTGHVQHRVLGPRAAPLDDEPKRDLILDVGRCRERRGLARKLVENELSVLWKRRHRSPDRRRLSAATISAITAAEFFPSRIARAAMYSATSRGQEQCPHPLHPGSAAHRTRLRALAGRVSLLRRGRQVSSRLAVATSAAVLPAGHARCPSAPRSAMARSETGIRVIITEMSSPRGSPKPARRP